MSAIYDRIAAAIIEEQSWRRERARLERWDPADWCIELTDAEFRELATDPRAKAVDTNRAVYFEQVRVYIVHERCGPFLVPAWQHEAEYGRGPR